METPFTPIDDIANARRKKKNRQAFYTPLSLVQTMVKCAENRHGCKALEPSAGDGRIVHALLAAGCSVDAYELDAEMNARCAAMGANMLGTDFLKSEPRGEYDLIVMNPPFQKGQAQKHIEHAYKHLSPFGQLIAVAPASVDVLLQECKLDLPGCPSATYERLPEETFRESGAGVKTLLVFIEGPGPCNEVCGFSNLSTANAAWTIECDRKLFEQAMRDYGSDALRSLASKAIADLGGSCYGVDWGELGLHFAEKAVENGRAPNVDAMLQEAIEKPRGQQQLFDLEVA